MKFLVDAQLPPGLCAWLQERGHLAIHVQDLGDEPPTDSRIAAFVEKEQTVLISKDEDFVTLRLPDRFAFLWLRCGNVSNRGLRKWLGGHWPSVERRLESGGPPHHVAIANGVFRPGSYLEGVHRHCRPIMIMGH